MATNQEALRFACPHCDQHIECGREWAGLALDCPTCGKPIRAPGVTDDSHSQPSVVSARPEARRESNRTTAGRGWAGKPAPWVEKAAGYSAIAPISGFALALTLGSTRSLFIAILAVLLILSGGVAGGLALLHLLRFGGRGWVKASVGTSISLLLLIVVVLPAWRKAVDRYREVKERQEMHIQRKQ